MALGDAKEFFPFIKCLKLESTLWPVSCTELEQEAGAADGMSLHRKLSLDIVVPSVVPSPSPNALLIPQPWGVEAGLTGIWLRPEQICN